MLSAPSERKPRILSLLLILLLGLRIPYLAGLRFLNWPDYESTQWLWQSYMVGTYLLTAVFLFLEKNRLDNYHITTFALFLFILLPIIQPIVFALLKDSIPNAFSHGLNRFPQALIGSILLAGLLASRKSGIRLGKDSLKWLILAVLVGIASGFGARILSMLDNWGHVTFLGWQFRPDPFLFQMANDVVFQSSFASVNEEPLFRGLLWGYLRDRNWKGGWILLFQGLLFWIAHFYAAIEHTYRWWILVPVAAILFGWIAWKSRSIASSMITHGFTNGLAEALAVL